MVAHYEIRYIQWGAAKKHTSKSYELALRKARRIASEKHVVVDIVECRKTARWVYGNRLQRVLRTVVYAGGIDAADQLTMWPE